MRTGWLLVIVLVAGCSAAPFASTDDVLFPDTMPSGESSGRADLDGDRREDCWSAEESSGSGFGGVLLRVEAPCGSARIELDTTSSFGNFLAVTPLPDALRARPQLVEGIVRLLYGPNRLIAATAADDTFRLLLGEPARWSPGPLRLPPSRVIVRDEPHELVAYVAHNHGPLRRVATCGALEVFATNHAVAVHDPAGNRSKWLHVATGVEKLRWPSISDVRCGADGTVAFESAGEALELHAGFPER